jgi:predicted N-acetyltransferase YhbS
MAQRTTTILNPNHQPQLHDLFLSVFTSSEGAEEGRLIGDLAAALAASIDNKEIICFGTLVDNSIIAAIFFTRLKVKKHHPKEEDIQMYLLAPVAVHTQYQRQGIGQALILHGLQELKQHRSVHVAITYGDPAFYSKVGFQPLSQNVIPAPFPLSMPQGWLGQSLSEEKPIPIIQERPTCVQPFQNPVYW